MVLLREMNLRQERLGGMMSMKSDVASIAVEQADAVDRWSRGLLDSLAHVLQQLADVVSTLTDAQYVASPVGVFTSSIGGHVRHCLDHVAAIVAGAERGFLDYDQRERGTDVEHNRDAALREIVRLLDGLKGIQPHMFGWPIDLTLMPASDGPCVDVQSSVGRELAFVQSHTIHHNAIIAATCKTLGVVVPEKFGFAPSTIAYLEHGSL